jgi:hypothetical protein
VLPVRIFINGTVNVKSNNPSELLETLYPDLMFQYFFFPNVPKGYSRRCSGDFLTISDQRKAAAHCKVIGYVVLILIKIFAYTFTVYFLQKG